MIEVGEYVRTKSGYIGKYIQDGLRYGTIEIRDNKMSLITEEYNVKHSKNIIDLIEVGDYVNGKKVIEADNCKGAMREVYVEGQNPEKDCGLYFEQIETVVTKEQFAAIEYKVGD